MTMMNQNAPEMIRLLAAQRHFYTVAKRLRAVRVFGSVALVFLAPIVLFAAPGSNHVMAIVGLAGLLIGEVGLERFERAHVRTAATIQEEFDTRLFELPWNEPRVGTRMAPEVISAAAARFGADTSKLVDWYGDTGTIPGKLAVLLDQRSNLVWDWRLRRWYAVYVVALICLCLALDVGIAIAAHLEVLQALEALFAPSAPAIVEGIRVARMHAEAATRKEELARDLQRHWEDGLRDLDSLAPGASRQVQDCIFDLRKDAPVLPDWWYHWFRSRFNVDMMDAVRQLHDEAEARYPTGSL
jgi:hypothetical protein